MVGFPGKVYFKKKQFGLKMVPRINTVQESK